MNGDFARVQRRVMDLHSGGRYRDALDVATEAARLFPERAPRTSYWIACLLARCGEPDRALAVLHDALAEGRWWDDRSLARDPDLEPVRDRLDGIRAECARRRAAAQAGSRPDLLVEAPAGATGRLPVLLALHWRTGNAQDTAPLWRAAVAAGALLALPQSSQVCEPGSFCWDDRALAEREIASAADQVRTTQPVDPARLVLGGASQGGALAILLALRSEPFSSRGFVAVIPSVGDGGLVPVRELAPLVEPAAARGVRGWMITGERDYARDAAEHLQHEMQSRGLASRLTVVPKIGHQIPEGFDAELRAALAFVLE